MKRDGSLPSPSHRPFKIIYLELTNKCNFTCDYCPIDRQTRKKIFMPTEFACRIIDQIAEAELTYFLTFHLMGEPYLHKDLCFLTAYAESRGIRVRLLTNGSLLETKRNEALFETGLARLEVGFRTPNDTSFNLRLRGGKLTLSEYVQRLKGLIADKIRVAGPTEVCIKFFIRSHASELGFGNDYEHLTSTEDNLDMARQFQMHALQTARSRGANTEDWEKVPIRVENGEYFILPGISLAFTRIQEFWMREQRGERSDQRYRALVGGCSSGFRDDFGVLASGDVTTCCVDYDGKNVIGNLHNQSLLEILESAAATRIRRSFQWFIPPTPFCRECLGGPTLASSVVKQIGTIAVDARDRMLPRKDYRRVRERLQDRSSGCLTEPATGFDSPLITISRARPAGKR